MQTHRPTTLIGVLGTHTEVGKTFVTANWLSYLRGQGLNVAARKPVQSFNADDVTTDAQQLSFATGEVETDVCSAGRNYPLALAPPMAADSLHRSRIELGVLLQEITWPVGIDVGVVETVGGPYSPIAHDGDSIDLIRGTQPDAVLLIADAGLGTLNAVRLCLQCIGDMPTTVYLNRFDTANELHRLNRQWLQKKYGVTTAIDEYELSAALSHRKRSVIPAKAGIHLEFQMFSDGPRLTPG
jgi:dethiobiotin synthetase